MIGRCVRAMLLAGVLGGAGTAALAADPPVPRAAAPAFQPGFVPFTFDGAKGRVLIQVPAFDSDMLYYVSAASGGGSVELPFDRGILTSAVIHFVRVGQKVLVMEVNQDFRSLTGDAAHRTGVADSFPTSLIATVAVESEAGGRVVVDATPLFMRDAANVEGTLRRTGQGSFRFDAARSSFWPAQMKAFPENTEIETIATFTADAPGALVANVTPDARHFSIRIHHSFLKAPTGYVPRVADPRIGVSTLRFSDFSKPVNESPAIAWITRWRLEKKNPSAPLSEPVKPITYYFDPAIPAPLRHAMKQGLLWWNKAFEKAGYLNAVEARDAPADMDPMDIRHAYVLWINRDERGFSSGGNYRDPRTGELLGSKTRMDTHRVRTIANYWDAYSGGLPADGGGITVADPSLLSEGALAGLPKGQRDLVLLRQALLTAHELGHSLGFGHNFASSLNERASVMEYPTPRVKVTNGRLDLSEAFMTSVGAYDDYMVRYAYTPFAPAAEKAGLDAIIAQMRRDGIIYVRDTDPRWTWYDDRATPTENLRETMAARRIMLDSYGPGMLSPGEPVGSLRNVRLWMAYLHHRYAIESAVKYVGGQFQNITVPGDPLPATQPIPAATQREVLTLLMQAIQPDALALPEPLLASLAPDPGDNLEDLSSDAVFDQLKAARILAAMVVEPLLDPARAARMAALSAREPAGGGGGGVTFAELLDTLMANSWTAPVAGTPARQALRRAVQKVTLDGMMVMAAKADQAPEARALVLERLSALAADLERRRGGDAVTTAFWRQSARDIARFLADPAANAPKAVAPAWGGQPRSRYPLPPGPPLG